MPNKMKGVVLHDDVKARLKHQHLLQDYQELEMETDDMRSKLEAAKERKLVLTAEVRFLRKRYRYLHGLKSSSSIQKIHSEQSPKLASRKNSYMEGKIFMRKEATEQKSSPFLVPIPKKRKHLGEELLPGKILPVSDLQKLPPIPVPEPKKRERIGEEVSLHGIYPVSNVQTLPPKPKRRKSIDQQFVSRRIFLVDGGKKNSRQSSMPIFESYHKGKVTNQKETALQNTQPVIDLNKERNHRVNIDLKISSPDFDLNQEGNLGEKEASLKTRVPLFDLNEVSTGDEELQSSNEPLNFGEATKGVIRGLIDEQANELKLSLCRNAGEGSSRMGKRKISWQDPVALRV